MKIIDSEIEKVEWILENMKLGVSEREHLELYLLDRKQNNNVLRDICNAEHIKWFEDPVAFSRWIKNKTKGRENEL